MRAPRTFLAALAPLFVLGLVAPAQQQRIDLDLGAASGGTLEVDLNSVTGSIEIAGHDAERVTIQGSVSAREWRDDNEVIVDQSGDVIRLYSEYLESRRRNDSRRMSAELTIRVPRRFSVVLSGAMKTTLRDIDGRIEVVTGNDHIEASGLSGEADIAVANGNLRIRDSELEGELGNTNGSLQYTGGSFRGSVSSTNGGAEIDAISGDLRVNATNGTVRLGDVAGSLSGESTNGSIRAGLVAGRIRVETINGSVHAALGGNDEVNIETVNGAVELDAPFDLSATFDIEVRQSQPERNRDRPEIRSDFPLEVEPGSIDGDEYRRAASGRSGSGQHRIEVHTMNGDVVIRSSR